MAILNKDYYKGEDIYSDGSIEDVILDYAINGKCLADIDPEEVEFPIFYHLSEERENIINWYPFNKDSKILEVGAGCGAITAALCRKAEKVVCVDLSLKRSTINFERHKDFDNLTIMVGNLNDMLFDYEFDYIILNGVLEYAIGFTEGDKPYETFINNQLKFLKNDGKILIAIENKMGLKYFAGAAEDHTDLYFAGLNGYKGINGVRTFTQKELTGILNNCGLKHLNYYYPYPDYKFPKEIFTDETLLTQNYGRDYYRFIPGAVNLFDESTVASVFAREGIAGKFSNSFFVEASKDESMDARSERIIYAKINSDRDSRYKIITTIEDLNGTKRVVKSALTDEANQHINNMSEREHKMSEGYVLLEGEKEENRISYPFLNKKTWNEMLIEYVLNGAKDKVIEILDSLYKLIGNEKAVEASNLYSTEFVEKFGQDRLNTDGTISCVNPANIDLILGNVFDDGGKPTVIDGEWIFDFYIPKAFIMWRAIKELTTDCPKVWDLLYIEDIYERYNVLEKDKEIYRRWDEHFSLKYVKANQLRFYSYLPEKISIEEVKNFDNKKINMNLYVDIDGKGFSEDTKIQKSVLVKNNKFKVEFCLEKDEISRVKNLRFDPIEGIECRCVAYVGRDKDSLRAINSYCKDNEYDLFLNKDPQYNVDRRCMDDSGKIVINGYIGKLMVEDCVKLLNNKRKGIFGRKNG